MAASGSPRPRTERLPLFSGARTFALLRRLALLFSLLGAAAVPGVAHGATFCVQDPSCTGTPQPTLPAAADASSATPEADRIEIGSGRIPFAGTTAIAYGQVEIVGEGRRTTLLQGSGDPGEPVLISFHPSTVVRDLAVELSSSGGTAGINMEGGGLVQAVEVKAYSGTNIYGLVLARGASARDVLVTLPETPSNVGISVDAEAGTTRIDESTVFGGDAVRIEGASRVDVQRSFLVGGAHALIVHGTADVHVDGLVAHLLSGGESAIRLTGDGSASGDTRVRLRHATLIAQAGAGYALDVFQNAARVGEIVARDVVVRRFDTTARLMTDAVNDVARLDIAYSAIGSAPPALVGGENGERQYVAGPGLLFDVDPQFFYDDGGDYRLTAASPLVDAGEPGGLLPGGSPVDLGGVARILDGDGDGTARRDIGAFELAPAPVMRDPPPDLAPGAAPLPELLVPRTLRLDAQGRVAMRVSCPEAAVPCLGRLRLRTRDPVRVRRGVKRRVTLGTRRFTVPAGTTRTVRVRLDRRAIKLARRLGKVRVRAIVLPRKGSAPLDTARAVLRAKPRRR